MDGVLSVMVSGLEEELNARMSGTKVYAANSKRPSRPADANRQSDDEELPVLKQGPDVVPALRLTGGLAGWLLKRVRTIFSKKK